MSDLATLELPALGAEGEPCGSCGFPLASNQRFCLNCGERRSEPRVDIDVLSAVDGTPPRPPAPVKTEAAWTPFAIVGSLAVLGAMMLFGVLIGKDDGAGVAAPAAQPVVVQSADDAGASQASKAAGAGSDANAKDKGKGKGKADGDKALTGDPDVLDQVAALENVDPDDYSKESAKLPDEIALPGEPPPADNKAPGAGGPAQTIGG